MSQMEQQLPAFADELEKIAGGWSRGGVRPFKATTLLNRPGKFMKTNFMTKRSGVKDTFFGNKTRQTLTTAAGGAAAALVGERKLKKAVGDWQTGREIRRQQEGRV